MPNLDAVVAAQQRLTALEREAIAARRERDKLIVAAFEAGASQYEIAKRLGLTRQAVQVAAKRGK